MIAGRFALAAPIELRRGRLVAARQSTTPSIGLDLMDSSTSIAMRVRNIMAVGFMNGSPSEIVGNSSGKPPASQILFFTESATARRWRLQLVSSLHELRIPMTGRPSKTSEGTPSDFIQERCMNVYRLEPLNQD